MACIRWLFTPPPGSPAKVIEHQKPPQLVAIQEGQEVASLVRRESHADRRTGSEPNSGRDQANALGERTTSRKSNIEAALVNIHSRLV